MRSPASGTSTSQPSSWLSDTLAKWPQCSPFVSLTAISAIVFFLLPNELLISTSSNNLDKFDYHKLEECSGESLSWVPKAIIPAEEDFSCGGGPFSFMAASLISISCDRSQIHLCCEKHDLCYEQYNISQAQCDDEFCSCMDQIRSSTYCENIAQPGLCLATRTFGHLFHWSSNCTSPLPADGTMVSEECLLLESLNQQQIDAPKLEQFRLHEARTIQ